MSKSIVILGAGSLGKIIAEMATYRGYEEIFFLDEFLFNKNGNNFSVNGIGIYGNFEKIYDKAFCKGKDCIIALGDLTLREKLSNEIFSTNLNLINLIHPKTEISKTSKIGLGSIVMCFAATFPNSSIGMNTIIDNHASVGVDVYIGNNSFVGPSVQICSKCYIEHNVYIGAGAVIIPGITIKSGAIIGANATVTKNILSNNKVVGTPAKPIKEN